MPEAETLQWNAKTGRQSLLRMGLISLPFVEWHQKTTSNEVSDNQNINGPMVWLCLAENSLNTCSILHFPV